MTASTDTAPMGALPIGYSLDRDDDGDYWLVPPSSVTIFSEPGEPWLVTDDHMVGRDWLRQEDVMAACCDYLAAIAAARGEVRS